MKLWSKLPKFDLSKTEDKLKLFILVTGFLLFALVGSATAIQLTMSPNFCKSCHIMGPEYQTWAATSHSNIRCTECHIEPGLVNLVKHKLGATKELYHYVTKTYETPLAMKHKIESHVCEKCHSVDTRQFTVYGDIIIPHDRHMQTSVTKIECVDCHYGVAHGKISGREVNVENDPNGLHGGDLAAWTIDDGRAQTIREFVKADMDDCIQCHVKNQQTIKCEACHSTIKTPDNHSPKEAWIPVHGKDAKSDINSCKSCHSYGMQVQDVPVKDKTIQYAWGNEYCAGCHATMPESHKVEGWRKVHKADVEQKGKTNCIACHNLDDKEEIKAPAQLTCTRCH